MIKRILNINIRKYCWIDHGRSEFQTVIDWLSITNCNCCSVDLLTMVIGRWWFNYLAAFNLNYMLNICKIEWNSANDEFICRSTPELFAFLIIAPPKNERPLLFIATTVWWLKSRPPLSHPIASHIVTYDTVLTITIWRVDNLFFANHMLASLSRAIERRKVLRESRRIVFWIIFNKHGARNIWMGGDVVG